MNERFRDRQAAGRLLGERLREELGEASNLLILALPRGGVPVGYEVAGAIGAPLDVFLVRKLGAPGQEELGMGAIAEGGVRVLNRGVMAAVGASESMVERVAAREEAELLRRIRAYRGDRSPPKVRGQQVILVDDGLATGATMRAAVAAVRALHPSSVVVAVPVAGGDTCQELEATADRVVCLLQPPGFSSVGAWYENFSQTTDEEVRELLSRDQARRPAAASSEPDGGAG